MAGDTTKKYIIQAINDNRGLKEFQRDLAKSKQVFASFGSSLSKDALVVSSSMANLVPKKGQTKVRKFTQEIVDGGALIKRTWQEIDGKGPSKLTQAIKKIAPVAEKILKPLKETENELSKLISINKNFGNKWGSTFKKATLVVKQLAGSISDKRMKFQGKMVTVPVEKMSTVVAGANGQLRKLTTTITTLANGQKTYKRTVDDVTNSFKGWSAEISKNNARLDRQKAKLTQINSIIAKHRTEVAKATKATMAQQAKASRSLDKQRQAALRLADAQKKNKMSINNYANGMKTLASRAMMVIPLWLAMRGAFMGVMQVIKESVGFMIAWEYQMAQIRVVTNESESTLKSLSNSLLQLSADMGVSNQELGLGAALYAQQGRAMDEILPLMSATAKLSLLTGRNITTSVSDMTAVLKSYKLEASDAINIVDLITSTMQCFDPETEVLTDTGWKNHETLSLKDRVFSLNLDTNRGTFEEIKEIFIDENYNGEMIKYSNNIDFMVTPKHKFPINSISNKNREFALQEICEAPNDFTIPSNCKWEGTFKQQLEGLAFDMKDLLEFIGLYLCKGSICGTTINISQYERYHSEEVALIKDLLSRMNIDYDYNGNRFFLKGNLSQLSSWLSLNCHAQDKKSDDYSKKMPAFIKDLPSEQIKTLLDSFLFGEGYKIQTPALYTYSSILKDDFIELVLKVGKTPSYRKYGSEYCVTMGEKKQHVLNKNKFDHIQYSGTIWCLETEPNHTIYARRNGTCYWSGNSHAITAADLTQAYKATASTAAALGISLSGLTGYITAIKTVTRDTGNKVGLTLRTLFSRITTTSAEALQIITKVPIFLDEMGKATTKVTPNLRNLETVMLELSEVFSGLGNAQKAQVATLVGGVRRQNQVFALFDNFTESIKAQTDALFGLGKASKAIDILTNTTELSIKQMAGAWGQFVNAIEQTDKITKTFNIITEGIQGVHAAIAGEDFKQITLTKISAESQDAAAKLIGFANSTTEAQKRLKSFQESVDRGILSQTKADEFATILGLGFKQDAAKVGIPIEFEPNLRSIQDAIRSAQAAVDKEKIEAQFTIIRERDKQKLIDNAKNLSDLVGDAFKSNNMTALNIGNPFATLLESKATASSIQSIIDVLGGFGVSVKGLQATFDDLRPDKFQAILDNLYNANIPENVRNINLLREAFAKMPGTSKKLEDFEKIIQNFIATSKRLADQKNIKLQLFEELKRQRTAESTIDLKVVINKETLTRELKALKEETAGTIITKLEFAKKELAILNKTDSLIGGTLDRKKASLAITIKTLEAEKKRAKLFASKDRILGRMKAAGASDLQVLIQEIVLMTELGEKEVEIAKKRDELANKKTSMERTTFGVALGGQLELLKIQGATSLQIIRTTIAMERKLGIEKKGVAFLRQQLRLQQAIASANKITGVEKSKILAKAIAVKRKNNAEIKRAKTPAFKRMVKKQEFTALKVGLSQEKIDSIIRPTEGAKLTLPTEFVNLISSNVTLNTGLGSLETAIRDLTAKILTNATGKPRTGTIKEATGARTGIGTIKEATPIKTIEQAWASEIERTSKIRALSKRSFAEQNQTPLTEKDFANKFMTPDFEMNQKRLVAENNKKVFALMKEAEDRMKSSSAKRTPEERMSRRQDFDALAAEAKSQRDMLFPEKDKGFPIEAFIAELDKRNAMIAKFAVPSQTESEIVGGLSDRMQAIIASGEKSKALFFEDAKITSTEADKRMEYLIDKFTPSDRIIETVAPPTKGDLTINIGASGVALSVKAPESSIDEINAKLDMDNEKRKADIARILSAQVPAIMKKEIDKKGSDVNKSIKATVRDTEL